MCGINGFNFNQPDLIEKMNRVIKHRGSDQKNIYYDDNFSLGHVSSSIIDLSEQGKQPLFNEDRSLALICNGEIYNFQEIRNKLEKKGHKFFSQIDSEILLHGYEEYGFNLIKELGVNGMFAFAILDIRKKEIFLARDRVGIKPLYYYFDGKKFIFSSEIKAILEAGVKREINFEAFNLYFKVHYIPAPYTIYNNIFKLPQGHWIHFKGNNLEIKKYWDLEDYQEINSKNEIKIMIRNIVKDSVGQSLFSDRPLGIYLSGGIDSTIIAGVAASLGKRKIQTFTSGFDYPPEDAKFNADLYLARKTSQYIDSDHNELMISGKDVLNILEKSVWHLDEPISDVSHPIVALLARYSKEKVAMVLSGGGGDELFGGYDRYRLSLLQSRFQKMPKYLRKNFFTKFILNIYGNKINKLDLYKKLNNENGVDRYFNFMSFKDILISQVIKADFFNPAIARDFYQSKYFSSMPTSDFEKYFMTVDFKTWLIDQCLAINDKMGMAFGLKERLPLLDYRLAELSIKIPTRFKINGKTGKSIFIEAMEDFLPNHVLNQPKRGWFPPMAKWIRTDLKDFTYNVLSPDYTSITKDMFDFVEIRKMLDGHISKKQYNLSMIWTLLVFQIWARKYLQN